ncbi:hypothetical protein [Ferrovum sp.]|uniref:hypothetical protein n=1 Tax=Ferrovum sp. TaxID=2609467 RepID=UPI00260B0345|nr:hypothetical protein [Ferrovum sp.]
MENLNMTDLLTAAARLASMKAASRPGAYDAKGLQEEIVALLKGANALTDLLRDFNDQVEELEARKREQGFPENVPF